MRGNLSPGATITIEALVVLDVHGKYCILLEPKIDSYYNRLLPALILARDIVKYLVDKNVCNIDDFNWVAQLRYYWRFDDVGKY